MTSSPVRVYRAFNLVYVAITPSPRGRHRVLGCHTNLSDLLSGLPGVTLESP